MKILYKKKYNFLFMAIIKLCKMRAINVMQTFAWVRSRRLIGYS